MTCDRCHATSVDKGRAMDGRRAYRCASCGHTWTAGMQGRRKRYSSQRPGYQFADTGAATLDTRRIPGLPIEIAQMLD